MTSNQTGPTGINHMSGCVIKGNTKVAGIINEAKQQNLAKATEEVQQILQQLSQTYPIETIQEKAAVAAEVVKEIEANPTLKTRLISAAKEGSLALLEKSLDNVVGATIVGAVRGWQETE